MASLCERIKADPLLQNLELLRIYWYDARPATGTLTNPVDSSVLNLASTQVYAQHESLLDALELKPDFALRLGETVTHEWRIGKSAMKNLQGAGRTIQGKDLVPNISQKGVDLRIGLDIARVSLTSSVSTIVAVTGDSDLVPAFKFARREGIRVFLDTMQHGVRRALKAHCDQLIDVARVAPVKKKRRKAKAKQAP